MIPLDHVNNDFQMSKGLEKRRFTMDVNSYTFRASLVNVYKDIISAMVRELMANAYDAAPDKQFDVKLPNSIDPSFYVRDYGVSMTHDFVMNEFSVSFRSTKRTTNAAVGQIGIGSKAPLGYTDAYTLTCWLDGEKRIYSVILDEEDIPAIIPVYSEPSDEPQGVKIEIAIKPESFEQVIRSFSIYSLGFKVQPNVLGASENPTQKVEAEGDGWFIVKHNKYTRSLKQHALIRQGCVVYPYPLSGNDRYGLPFNLDSLVIFDVPIGTAKFTTSREEVVDSADLKDRVMTICSRMLRDIGSIVESEMAKIDNQEDAVVKAGELINNLGLKNGYIISWKGKRIYGQVTFNLLSSRYNSGYEVERCHRFSDDGQFTFDIHSKDEYIFVLDPSKITHGASRVQFIINSQTSSKSVIWVRASKETFEKSFPELDYTLISTIDPVKCDSKQLHMTRFTAYDVERIKRELKPGSFVMVYESSGKMEKDYAGNDVRSILKWLNNNHDNNKWCREVFGLKRSDYDQLIESKFDMVHLTDVITDLVNKGELLSKQNNLSYQHRDYSARYFKVAKYLNSTKSDVINELSIKMHDLYAFKSSPSALHPILKEHIDAYYEAKNAREEIFKEFKICFPLTWWSLMNAYYRDSSEDDEMILKIAQYELNDPKLPKMKVNTDDNPEHSDVPESDLAIQGSDRNHLEEQLEVS